MGHQVLDRPQAFVMERGFQDVIAAVDAGKCKTKVSKRKDDEGQLLFSPIDMNAAFKRLLRLKKWDKGRQLLGDTKRKLIRETLAMSATEQKRLRRQARNRYSATIRPIS